MTHAAAAHSAHDDTHGHPPTSTGLDNKKIAIWAFIGSECMLFTSLISTYLIYKGRSVVGPFPHEPWTNAEGRHFGAILNIPVTSFSTFILLMSSLAMVLAHNAVVNKNVPKRGLGARIAGSSKLWLCACQSRKSATESSTKGLLVVASRFQATNSRSCSG